MERDSMSSINRSSGWDQQLMRIMISVVAFLGAAVVLWVSGSGISGLRLIVRGMSLENLLWLVWLLLVLLRQPIPGQSLFGRWSGWQKAILAIQGATLLFTLLLLGTGLTLFRALWGIPGFGALAMVAVAMVGLGPVVRGRDVRVVIRLEILLGLALSVGLIVRALAPVGSASTTVTGFIVLPGVIALLLGLALLLRLPVRTFPPLDDPAQLIVGGSIAILAALSEEAGLSTLVAIALLLLPTVVAIVEIHALAASGTFQPRAGQGLPVLEALREPTDLRERTIRRIKGTYRRTRTRELIDAGEDPDPSFLEHELAPHLKLALQMQVGAQARGGEDLPDLLDGEVELARITYSQTVHGEVVSLRGVRAGDDVMALRMVDEYETEFSLPFDRARGGLSPDEIVRLFREANPAPVDVGPFLVLSEVFPDLPTAFSRKFQRIDRVEAPRGVGAGIRTWFSVGVMGFVLVWRMALDFRGHSISVETRMYAFGAFLVRSLITSITPALAPALWALWIPVPALIIRRVRTVGLGTIRGDVPMLALGIVAAGVIGTVVLEFPLWLGSVAAGPSILMLYLAFRQGPMERAILSG